MKKSKTIGIISLIMMSVLVFASCDKNGYEPIQTSTDACQIIVQCIAVEITFLTTRNLLTEYP